MSDAVALLRERMHVSAVDYQQTVSSFALGGGVLPTLADHKPNTAPAEVLARAGRPPFVPRWKQRQQQRSPGKSPVQRSPSLPVLVRRVSGIRRMSTIHVTNPRAHAAPAQPAGASDAEKAAAAAHEEDARKEEELGAHKKQLFSFSHQFTYGLLNFDDETVAATLHVDQEARLKPSLLVQHDIKQLSFRDVQRADILSRINPPAPEEVLAREMEMRAFHRRRKEQP
jgi:hypothetical protein